MPDPKARYKLVQRPDGLWESQIVLPGAKGTQLVVRAAAGQKHDAMGKAAQLAQQAIANPNVANLLPPGSVPAINMALQVATLVRSGEAKAIYKSTRGAAKKLMKALF